MSVQTPEGTEGAAGMLGPVNSVMSTIFDTMAADPAEAPDAQGAETDPEAGVEPEAPAEGGAEPVVPATPEPDGEDVGREPEAGEAGVRPAQPAVAPTDYELSESFVAVGEALETRFEESVTQQAVAQAQEDYPHYIELLNLHPMELIGKELPSIDGSDNQVSFRTPEEVAQWQEAVKTILQRELESSVAERRQAADEVLDVVHASISLFQDNPDLVPGSKHFNKDLAEQFTKIAAPYALKMNGKLTGYSIPVQGIVDQVRAQVRAKVAATPAAAAKPAAKKAAPARKPQAGIASKAGTSGDGGEDYSAMWGALGITNAPI